RRLIERGVRFVQVWSGNDNAFPRRNWDSHEDVRRDHGPLSMGFARGASALIQDLKQRGLLEDTVILWTTEFGRMPSSQGGKGRDHNPYCFTNWLAGGGIKGGTSYGPSDEFGYKPLDRKSPTEVYDVHATVLHLLGIDHTRLTVRHDGIDRRETVPQQQGAGGVESQWCVAPSLHAPYVGPPTSFTNSRARPIASAHSVALKSARANLAKSQRSSSACQASSCPGGCAACRSSF